MEWLKHPKNHCRFSSLRRTNLAMYIPVLQYHKNICQMVRFSNDSDVTKAFGVGPVVYNHQKISILGLLLALKTPNCGMMSLFLKQVVLMMVIGTNSTKKSEIMTCLGTYLRKKQWHLLQIKGQKLTKSASKHPKVRRCHLCLKNIRLKKTPFTSGSIWKTRVNCVMPIDIQYFWAKLPSYFQLLLGFFVGLVKIHQKIPSTRPSDRAGSAKKKRVPYIPCLEDHSRTCEWLITMVNKSPK